MRSITALTAAVLVVLPLIAGCGSGGGDDGGTRFALTYSGTWNGSWSNTTRQTQGISSLVVSVNTTTKTVNFTLDLAGNAFGTSGLPPTTLSGTYSSSGFTVSVAQTGGVTGYITVDKDGKVSGQVSQISGTNIDLITFDGTTDGKNFNINFTVKFKDGTVVRGTITLTKQ
jgi:hypothetical protein